MAYAETAAGCGLLIGPILGGALNVKLGYMYCYLVLGGILSFALVMTLIIMPGCINDSDVDAVKDPEQKQNLIAEKREFDEQSAKAGQVVKYSWFLGNRRALFALTSTGMTMVFESFKEGFMTIVLERDYHID